MEVSEKKRNATPGNSTNRDGLLFGIGLAAGALVGWFLNSDTGRRLRKDTAETINDWSEKAMDGADELMARSKAMAQEYKEKAKEKASDTKAAVEEFVNAQN